MGTCIRCKGEYDDRTKLCTRCGANNVSYERQLRYGFVTWLLKSKPFEEQFLLVFATFLPLVVLLAIWIVLAIAGFAVSETVFWVTLLIGLVIWFLAVVPMFVLSYTARFTSWEREYLRGLDFLAKRPQSTGLLAVGSFLIALLLGGALGVFIILNIVFSIGANRLYTVLAVNLALFFSLSIAAFCYLVATNMEVRRLRILLPRPLFTDGRVLQELVIERVRESLKLRKSEPDIAEVKRTDDAGIEMTVTWTTKEKVTDKRGEQIEEITEQRAQVKADKWGRVISIEEKKKD